MFQDINEIFSVSHL